MKNKDLNGRVGERMRLIRTVKGLKQTWVAQQVGISQGLLSRIEKGSSRASFEQALRIAQALGCSVQDFVDPGPDGPPLTVIVERR